MSSARRLGESSLASRIAVLRRLIDGLRFSRSVLFTIVLTAVATQVGYALPITRQSCSVPGVQRSARCGAIEVPENPNRPGSRKLEIHFAVIPVTNGHALHVRTDRLQLAQL